MQADHRNYELRRVHLLSEPLSLTFVERYEKIFGAEVPDAYRSFLLTVGDGGLVGGGPLRYLGAPMFEAPDWPRGLVSFDTRNVLDEIMCHPFDDRLFESGHDPAPPLRRGLLYLRGKGFADWDALVVTGPRRGQMLSVDGPMGSYTSYELARTELNRYSRRSQNGIAPCSTA